MEGGEPGRDEQRERIAALLDAHLGAHLISIGAELDLFPALAAEPSPPGALADRLGLDRIYVETWCRTAYAFGLLDEEAGSFRLPPHMDVILGDSESPFYMADLADLHLTYGDTSRRHPDLYRSGKTIDETEEDPAMRRVVARATRHVPSYLAHVALPRMAPDLLARLEGGGRLVDVGCGSGTALIVLCRAFPAVEAVGYEPDEISAELARYHVAEAGLSDRVTVKVAAADAVEEVAAFDVATMVQVLHHLPDDRRAPGLEAVRGSLRPGGGLLVFDEPYPPDLPGHRRPAGRGVAVSQFYESIYGIRMETAEGQRRLLEGAGFGEVEATLLQGGRYLLTVGRV